MSEPINFTSRVRDQGTVTESTEDRQRPVPIGVPSNEVYARVGDIILRAARDGVRRGLPPEDIIREIRTDHHVQLSIGQLRLLLAARRLPE